MIENKVSKTNNSIASVNGNSKFGINNSNSNNSKSNTTTTLTAAISASNTNTSTTTTSSPHHQILTSPMKSNIGSVSTNSSGGATNNNNNNNNSYSACNITQIFQKTILRTEQDFIGQSLENYLQIHGNEHNNRHSPRFNINKDNSPSSSPITNTTTTTTTTSTSSNNTNLLTATTNNNNNNSLSPKINSENGNNNNNSHLSIKVSLSQIKKSFIYILVNMSFCTITNVHDSTITLGPCTDFIEVNECSRLTIISITKGIRIKSSNNISLFLCTNQKPIITSDCSDIKLAPYNTHYPNLEIQINQSKLSTQLLDNQWNNPLIFKSFLPQGNSNNNNESNLNTTSNTTTTTSTTSTTTTTTGLNNSSNDLNSSSGSLSSSIGESPSFSNIYKILDPEEFYTFVVPFLIKGKTKSNPCELPSKYLKSLVTKSNAVHKLHKSIQQTNVDNKTKAHLLYLVESKFQEWLKETDNIRQINDLINLKRN